MGRNAVEQKKALRTCQEFLTVEPNETSLVSICSYRSWPWCERPDGEHLQRQRDISITILIVPLKHVRHPLETDTRLHEQVKTQSLLPRHIVAPSTHIPRIRAEEQLHKLRTEPIPKRNQRVAELGIADIPTAIGVEAVEEAAPRREEPPEAAELVKVYGPAPVGVEHADHHSYGVFVEGCVVPIDEGAAQAGFGELAAAVFVYGYEEGPEGVAVVGAALGWANGGRALGWGSVVGALGWRWAGAVVGWWWWRRGIVAPWRGRRIGVRAVSVGLVRWWLLTVLLIVSW